MWIQNVMPVITSFLVVHLIAGCILGIYRYGMIEKYQFDYYDAHPRSFLGKIGHNLVHGLLGATTLYFSISIIVIALVAIYALKHI